MQLKDYVPTPKDYVPCPLGEKVAASPSETPVSTLTYTELVSAFIEALRDYDNARVLGAEDLLFLKAAVSTTSSSYTPIINETVPSNYNYEPWILIICSSSGEDAANFRAKLGGGEYQVIDFNTNVRVPVYIPLPDKLKIFKNDKLLVDVKSDGSTTVKAFAIIVGRKVRLD